MFDDSDPQPSRRPVDPAKLAEEKVDEFRIHAQLAAVFEATRKFDAVLRPDFDPELARTVQRTMAKLERSKSPDVPILLPEGVPDAAMLLDFAHTHGLATNDYYIYRRPGEVTITRWIEGEQVEWFYQRLQAHFDAAMEGFRDELRADQAWKQDPEVDKLLEALGTIKVNMPERYLRELILKHRLYVLSTQTADELDILYLSDYVMEVAPEDLVGRVSAPPEEPTERDRAWFFRMFSLRGLKQDVEQMCFFTYLQRTEDTFDLD